MKYLIIYICLKLTTTVYKIRIRSLKSVFLKSLKSFTHHFLYFDTVKVKNILRQNDTYLKLCRHFMGKGL